MRARPRRRTSCCGWSTALDPLNRAGKLVLIGRFGAQRIGDAAAAADARDARSGPAVVWTIDPMHGNTSMSGKRKVRRLPDILAEIDAFFAIARAEGVHRGGLHLEMSALDVTECLGGRGPASIDELEHNWLTACDPRLNRAQAIDLAAHVAALLGVKLVATPRRAAARRGGDSRRQELLAPRADPRRDGRRARRASPACSKATTCWRRRARSRRFGVEVERVGRASGT